MMFGLSRRQECSHGIVDDTLGCRTSGSPKIAYNMARLLACKPYYRDHKHEYQQDSQDDTQRKTSIGPARALPIP